MSVPRESGLVTADTLIKSGQGFVYSITLAYKGVSAGEIVTLNDLAALGTTNDTVVFVFPGANGTFHFEWPKGKKFQNGIVFNKGATGGSVYAELTYR